MFAENFYKLSDENKPQIILIIMKLPCDHDNKSFHEYLSQKTIHMTSKVQEIRLLLIEKPFIQDTHWVKIKLEEDIDPKMLVEELYWQSYKYWCFFS